MIPQRTRDGVIRRFGQPGEEWLVKQEKVVAGFTAGRDLKLQTPFSSGWDTNVSWPCSSGEEQLVLKTGYPEPELFTEMAVLDSWRGRPGCVQLIEKDEEHGLILMERVLPGTTFRESDLTSRSAQIPGLFSLVPGTIVKDLGLPSYEEWFRRAVTAFEETETNRWFQHHLVQAGRCLDDVLAGPQALMLLHGDLHHENMLLDQSGDYVAIDPKGVLGPPVLEYGRFMHNFVSDEPGEAKEILMQRAETLAGPYSVSELCRVGYLDLVLACTWSINSGDPLAPEVPELLGSLEALSAR